MVANFAYTKAQIAQVIEYKLLFPEEKSYPTIVSLLESIPRKKLINLSLLLINKYANSGFEAIDTFFTIPQSIHVKKDFKNRFSRVAKDGFNYIFCTDQTSIELLRYAFSVEHKPDNLGISEYESNIFKAILLINEKLHVFPNIEEEEDKSLRISKMLIVNSFSQKGINDSDYNQVFREAFTKSIDFIEFVKSNDYFKAIYLRFLKRHGIADYKSAIKTILGVYSLLLKDRVGVEQRAGIFIYDPVKDKDKLLSKSFLEKSSINWTAVIPLNCNHDYKVFRDKPLIKQEENCYAIFNLTFFIEKLFNSLYFDFQQIAKQEFGYKNFENEYKEGFLEKVLLVNYLEKINIRNKYFALSSKQMKDICDDVGEPDYYLRSKMGAAILIEHKDIKINAEIKQSRNLDLIISEYKNKLLRKSFSNGKLIENPKPIGIGQLIQLIKKIRNGIFNWDKQIEKDAIIYPVLVLTDSNFIPDGLSHLMNSWFLEELVKVDIKSSNVKPLIVMTTTTFLLYQEEFKLNGMEYYFEKYYESIKIAEISQSGNPYLDIANMNIPFFEYMLNVFRSDFHKTFEEYRLKLFPS